MNSKKLLFLILFPLFLQSQDLIWEKTMGGKHAEFLYDVQPTADYGFILAGSSLSLKSGNKEMDNMGDLDYWIWKMNEKGEPEWQKSFGGNGSDQLISLKLTSDGGFILGGTSNSNSTKKEDGNGNKKEDSFGLDDFWVLKLNAKGDEEWQKSYGGFAQDNLIQVIVTKEGGYLLAGSSASEKSGNKETEAFGGLDVWIIKIDTKGTVEWQKSFGGKYNDDLRSVIQTSDGGFLLGCSSNSVASGNKTETHKGLNDFWVLKINAFGEEEWQKVMGSSFDDQLSTLVEDQKQNYLIGGNTITDQEKKQAMWIVKLDTKGFEIWNRKYEFENKNALASIIVTEDNGCIVSGHAENKSKSLDQKSAFVLFKIDETGNQLWENQLDKKGKDILRKTILTRDGGFLLAGTRKQKNSSNFLVVKLNNKAKPIEVKQTIEAFPNPTVQFSNVIVNYEYSYGTATLFDLNGRTISTQDLKGERTVPIDFKALPQGIYLVEIKTNIQKDAVKIMKN